jgi:NADH-quinone oxidoreductase subunit H
VVPVVLITGSLSTRTIVDAQSGAPWHWNVVRLGVVPFVLFLIAGIAETNRPPFDVVEAESELVGGFNTEYSSIRFALFYLAEFLNTITMSAIVVTLFFGGPAGPVPHIAYVAWVFPILWFLGKTLAFCFMFVWLRGALPRMRYDRLMDLGWKRLIPASLAWMLLVAGFMISAWWGVGLVAAVLAGAALLSRTFTLGQELEAADQAVLPPVGSRPISPSRLRELTDRTEEDEA